MGKPGKWLRNFLVGKKDKDKDKEREKEKNKQSSVPEENPTTAIPSAPTTPKEKRRWSFRRPSAASVAHKDVCSTLEPAPASSSASAMHGAESEQKKHALAVAAATAAAADAAVAAAQAAAAAVIQLTTGAGPRANPAEEAAAIRIQSVYRSHLVIPNPMVKK